jgi:parallel beta-helix repeat protein
VIRTSLAVKPGLYRLASSDESGKTGAVRIVGDGITVDFKGAVLEGSPTSTPPDQRQGTGLWVTGKNVTIKNARVRGYKTALFARDAPGLKVLDCDFSDNWKQRLRSDREKEDLGDWMSFHQNDKDEWLRFGAGAYLTRCDGFKVRDLRVNRGQCGLMLDECDGGTVVNCDFSFNSAVGLGMFRSSGNTIAHNKMDWCVRGYSHGVYNRGQDSTGILAFEQCHRNVFAYNSATHGGDGFFLWAGQTTMDTGQGGCNDNLLYGNDFSHSPANAIEATFSRNSFVHNLLIDCWHGVWGGYSYETEIRENVFRFNGEAIAIEHGQQNMIVGNSFDGDTVGVFLWQNDRVPDPTWGYPKFRDTRNRGTVVSGNTFKNCAEAALLLGSGQDITVTGNTVSGSLASVVFTGRQEGVSLAGNSFVAAKKVDLPAGVASSGNTMETGGDPPRAFVTRGGNALTTNEPPDHQDYMRWLRTPFAPPRDREVRPLPGGMDAFLPEGHWRGRRFIMMDEWGPYDFRRPLFWPRDPKALQSGQGKAVIDLFGPRGRWRLVSARGARLSASRGQVPGTVKMTWDPAIAVDIDVVLEYVGAATVDSWGRATPAGKPVRFGIRESRLPVSWNVRWWAWDPATQDPRTQTEAFRQLLATPPLREEARSDLDVATGGSPAPGVPVNHFATVAEGEFVTKAGKHRIEVTTDDGCRVWLDGKMVIDEWRYQGPTQYQYEAHLKAGKHIIRIEHFEIDGYSALKAKVTPAR